MLFENLPYAVMHSEIGAYLVSRNVWRGYIFQLSISSIALILLSFIVHLVITEFF